MSDELENQAPADGQQDAGSNNRPDNRIKDLSDKYAAAAEDNKKLLDEKNAATREVEFYKGFTPLTSKYNAAGEFQDQIKEKVMAGYEVEDATVAVLSREGRLNSAPAEVRPKESAGGGSAPTTLRSNEKTLSEMSYAEKRDELMKLEQETGGLSNLFNRNL